MLALPIVIVILSILCCDCDARVLADEGETCERFVYELKVDDEIRRIEFSDLDAGVDWWLVETRVREFSQFHRLQTRDQVLLLQALRSKIEARYVKEDGACAQATKRMATRYVYEQPRAEEAQSISHAIFRWNHGVVGRVRAGSAGEDFGYSSRRTTDSTPIVLRMTGDDIPFFSRLARCPSGEVTGLDAGESGSTFEWFIDGIFRLCSESRIFIVADELEGSLPWEPPAPAQGRERLHFNGMKDLTVIIVVDGSFAGDSSDRIDLLQRSSRALEELRRCHRSAGATACGLLVLGDAHGHFPTSVYDEASFVLRSHTAIGRHDVPQLVALPLGPSAMAWQRGEAAARRGARAVFLHIGVRHCPTSLVRLGEIFSLPTLPIRQQKIVSADHQGCEATDVLYNVARRTHQEGFGGTRNRVGDHSSRSRPRGHIALVPLGKVCHRATSDKH